jgi:cytochrome P450
MGSRSCVGRNLAVVEVYKYVATFVRRFDASIVNTERPWVTKSQWFSFQRDFWIDLRLRVGSEI